MNVTIAIPTYGREEVLLETIRCCLNLSPPADELIIVDQTQNHDLATESQLTEWHRSCQIRWIRLTAPSIPTAMNHALVAASNPVVLFLDDDIIPEPGLIAAHRKAHENSEYTVVVGQIIQPWQNPVDADPPTNRSGLKADLDFPFNSTRRAELNNVMAGHMSVKRQKSLAIGGFDENFVGNAYRFETEFARRISANGGKIIFEPAASIRHLRADRGGTRIHGDHLASASPNHGVGDYYFAFRYGVSLESARYISCRIVREICTRFHLKHPWYIPVKLIGEVRALGWAWQLHRKGPSLLEQTTL